jgi:hypothetical protein
MLTLLPRQGMQYLPQLLLLLTKAAWPWCIVLTQITIGISKGIRAYGPNVVRVVLVSGEQRWLIMGAYIPPSETNASTLDYISEAAESYGHPLILLGDLNFDFDNVKDERHAATAGMVASLGVTDTIPHFRQRKWRDTTTWRMPHRDNYIYSRCDYILTENVNCFQNVSTITPRHFTSDHLLVKSDLSLLSPHRNPGYEKTRRRYPLYLSKARRTATDNLIQELKDKFVVPRPAMNTRTNSWISDKTWALLDHKARAYKSGTYGADMWKSLCGRV